MCWPLTSSEYYGPADFPTAITPSLLLHLSGGIPSLESEGDLPRSLGYLQDVPGPKTPEVPTENVFTLMVLPSTAPKVSATSISNITALNSFRDIPSGPSL